MSTKATAEATIETFPRWASQVNGVSCQTRRPSRWPPDKANGRDLPGHQGEGTHQGQ